ncbi:flavin reductase family protein [Streptomyces rectiverticillatus]|uniref:flavin reductase family protein n=1 Tax=Streptomyces rectiverticillatus TaxID=173860 RepID=UPI0015C3FF98|nr:flavin reductase family protein [Streptomyces rectiverticillatus]
MISQDLVEQLMRYGTSTVGIITAAGRSGVNLMSAEWTYLVARRPPHFAVGCQIKNHTTGLILERREFGLTLCDASMASLANFAGTFTGAEIDKSSASGLRLREPVVTGTPTVEGGTLSAECRVRSVVDLPDYALIVGEAVWMAVDPARNATPLVKHGSMYELGERILSREVTGSATAFPDGTVRLCASAQGVDDPEQPVAWTVTLSPGTGGPEIPVGTVRDGEDLDVVIELPRTPLPGDALIVARPDCRPVRVALPTT